METSSVTSKGQVTIPLRLRKKLGIRQGSKVAFDWVDDHAELRVVHPSPELPQSGYRLLKSKRAAVPADLDPASLLKA